VDAISPAHGGTGGTGRAPSMQDVAELAGVSHQTVSRVINRQTNVRSQTRARVLAAMQQLGYRPNTAARALVTGRSRTLGVVTLDTTLFGPASTLHAVERAAREAGYFVSIASLRSIARASLHDALNRLADQAVEGVIVIAPLTSAEDALQGLPDGLPVVAVEGNPQAELAAVSVDQIAGGRIATEHLLAEGHRTVWHVAGPGDWLEAQGRVTGWEAALRAAGREVPPPLSGDWSARSGYEAGRLLARMSEVDAVFVANDHMSLGLLRAVHEQGRRVPADLSVVGFDDIPEAAYFLPPLTTVRQDFGEVGRLSLQALLDQIRSGARNGQRHVVDPTLVVRDSTRAR
jgi:DNA-binding LacI/PurR family transcriptional regulator